ncbi:hypothetical protein [Agrobacterium vitis]|nr:hypothetical protein [Agrobacterium vitis]
MEGVSDQNLDLVSHGHDDYLSSPGSLAIALDLRGHQVAYDAKRISGATV